MELPTKEIAEVQEVSSGIVLKANATEITNAQTYSLASTVLSDIKEAQKLVKERKESITKPAREIIAQANELFRPIEAELVNAESIIKGKVLKYTADQRRKEEQMQARVERGTMKVETALGKMDENSVHNTANLQVKKIKKLRIKDLRKVDEKYFGDPRVLEALMTAARTDAMAAYAKGLQLPGFEVYEEETVAAS